jgi:hypothetical protein
MRSSQMEWTNPVDYGAQFQTGDGGRRSSLKTRSNAGLVLPRKGREADQSGYIDQRHVSVFS